MVFTSILDSEIARGKPNSTELFGKIQGNLEDLNSRIGATGGESVHIINQVATGLFPGNQVIEVYRASRAVTLTECILTVLETHSNSSSELIIDVLTNTSASVGSATTIFQTKPSVVATAGRISSNAAFTSGLGEISAGTYFFLKFDQYQTNVKSSHIILR